MFIKYIGRRCIHIENMACFNYARAKQYSEASTARCRAACMDNLACTGGYHWHQGDICYHFGVEGSAGNECPGIRKSESANAFLCSGIPGRKYTCLETQVFMMYRHLL